MSNADYYFKTDDEPTIERTLPGDLEESGASVVFNMKPVVARGVSTISGGSVTVESGAYDGDEDETDVSFDFSTGELSDSGEYLAEFEATYADGEVRSYPEGRYLFIKVNEDLN